MVEYGQIKKEVKMEIIMEIMNLEKSEGWNEGLYQNYNMCGRSKEVMKWENMKFWPGACMLEFKILKSTSR